MQSVYIQSVQSLYVLNVFVQSVQSVYVQSEYVRVCTFLCMSLRGT